MDGQSLILVNLLIIFHFTISGNAYSEYRIPKMSSERTETYVYKDVEYIIQNLPLTWDDAQIICRGHYNGSLATLDTEDKANYMAEALAESRFAIDSMWIAARRSATAEPYRWNEGPPLRRTLSDVMHGEDSYQRTGNHYPMWLNRTLVPVPEAGADCVGLGRVYHDRPVFIDLPCLLERPFVCQREAHLEIPIQQQRSVKCKSGWYHVYSGRVTWEEAAAHCVIMNMQLANVATLKCMKKLGLAMLKARPSIENAWVGARAVHGNWSWIRTGLSIYEPSPFAGAVDVTSWPPLRDEHVIKEEGCLQIDRHTIEMPMFLRSRCERKMQFICYDSKDTTILRSQSARYPSDDNYFYVLVKEPLSWQQAFENCKSLNGTLGLLTNHEIFIQLLLVMGENKDNPVNHIWMSGRLTMKNQTEPEFKSISTWYDPVTGIQIADPKNVGTSPEFYLAPWLDEEYSMENACLNLDRQNHLSGLVYGLPCNTLQSSICMISMKNFTNTIDKYAILTQHHHKTDTGDFDGNFTSKGNKGTLRNYNIVEVTLQPTPAITPAAV